MEASMSGGFDAAVIGAGIMGSTVALHLARAGLNIALVDRGGICRQASGVNAGTLTLHMTRAALIPYAMRGFELWRSAREWLGTDLEVRQTDGLSLAFTAAEADLLEQRVAARRAHGAPIELVSSGRAVEIEPGLGRKVRLAAHCRLDGFASAYRTGRAFLAALRAAGAHVFEYRQVTMIEQDGPAFCVRTAAGTIQARRLVLAGGVWLEEMLRWLGVSIRIKCLVNQLAITERLRPVMRTVLGIANGLLSLKQFDNGTVLIGGGWQGRGDPARGAVEVIPENLIGNLRLARWVVPDLVEARIVRIWLGLEAETADAMPIVGQVPGVDGAFVIGSVHSGYTSGPFIGSLLADLILDRRPEIALFDPARLMTTVTAGSPQHA
jgi:glycine/D-amino acid oxidase-like deaminating enzyme